MAFELLKRIIMLLMCRILSCILLKSKYHEQANLDYIRFGLSPEYHLCKDSNFLHLTLSVGLDDFLVASFAVCCFH